MAFPCCLVKRIHLVNALSPRFALLLSTTPRSHRLTSCPLPPPVYSYSATQADVATFKAISSAPDAAKYPNAARWYKHIASYEEEFATLSGDASKPYTVYGPEETELALNPAKAPAAAADDDDDVDLFGSDDEEEDAEAERIREERLAEYRKKKEGKTKPAAKSMCTLDVKPWGMSLFPLLLLSQRAQRRPCTRWAVTGCFSLDLV